MLDVIYSDRAPPEVACDADAHGRHQMAVFASNRKPDFLCYFRSTAGQITEITPEKSVYTGNGRVQVHRLCHRGQELALRPLCFFSGQVTECSINRLAICSQMSRYAGNYKDENHHCRHRRHDCLCCLLRCNHDAKSEI